MPKRSEAYAAALLSLSWAVFLSLAFLLIGWGLGLILAFSAGLPTAGAIISFAMIAVSLVLMRIFTPPARRAALLEADREGALVSVFRRWFVLLCGILSAAVLTAPLLGGSGAATYFSLFALLCAALAIGIFLAVYLLRRRLYTTEARKHSADRPVSAGLNALSLILIFLANLALLIYRLFWMLTGYENEIVDAVCILGFALLTLGGTLLPLFGRSRAVSRGWKLLASLRSFLAAVALTMANLSFSFLRMGEEHGYSFNPAVFVLGLLLLIGVLAGFRLLLSRRTKKK